MKAKEVLLYIVVVLLATAVAVAPTVAIVTAK